MRERILNYIEKNSRVDLKELAVLLGTTEAEITQELSDMESEGIICGYHTLGKNRHKGPLEHGTVNGLDKI